MQLAFLTPINHLEETKRGDILYILAHLLTNKKYYQYCLESTQYKIIDNSVHEGCEISTKQYIQYAIDLKVNEIILQDVMDDFSSTIMKTKEQLNLYYDLLKQNNIKIMAVIQGVDKKELLKSLQLYCLDNRIDVIGVSFTMCLDKFCEEKYMNYFINRSLIVDAIKQFYDKFKFYKQKPIHLLGSSAWYEAIIYSKYKFIRSNDTKLLARLAKAKEELIERVIGKPNIKLNMKETFDEKQKELMISHIETVKRLVKG